MIDGEPPPGAGPIDNARASLAYARVPGLSSSRSDGPGTTKNRPRVGGDGSRSAAPDVPYAFC